MDITERCMELYGENHERAPKIIPNILYGGVNRNYAHDGFQEVVKRTEKGLEFRKIAQYTATEKPHYTIYLPTALEHQLPGVYKFHVDIDK